MSTYSSMHQREPNPFEAGHAAEWEAICAELESLRTAMKDMSYTDGVKDGAELAHDAMAPAIKEMQEELAEAASYKVMWESIPVIALDRMIRYGDGAYMPNSKLQARTIVCEWIDDRWPWVTEVDEDDNYIYGPKDKLEFLRSTRPVMDSDGVLLSHDAYDMLERQAAIGRSVPWDEIRFCTTVTDRVAWIHSEFDPNTEINILRSWLAANTPKEIAE